MSESWTSSRDAFRPAARTLIGIVFLAAGLACTDTGNCLAGNPLMPTCLGEQGLDEPRLVFQSHHESNRFDLRDVYTMTSRGTDVRRVTTSGLANNPPRWSPDGREIAYSEFTPDRARSRLVVIAADGSDPRVLTPDGPGMHTYPAWAPDGKRIAFMSNRHNASSGLVSIYVVNSDGSNLVRLTTGTWSDAAPHWSPDGARIVFHSTRAGGVQIFVMNADGTGQQQLTTAGSNRWPNWSPNGTRISFSSERTSDGEPDNGIYIMNADGSGQKNLTNGHGMFDMYSTWSADGGEIYFCSNRTGMHVWRVRTADGVVRPVSNTGTTTEQAQPNARWPLSFPRAP